jgi:NADPH:quinone reductase-like Zn-dependent oxidoreductase
MKAIVYREYGSPDVLNLEEIEKPTLKDNEVLVKVHAASINYADWVALTGKPLIGRMMIGGIQKPTHMILGYDIAGKVEAVGKDVKQFQPGDDVFGDISSQGGGGLAEYVAVPEKMLVLKPANVPYEEAAAVPLAGVTALQGVRTKGQVKPGQKVLIVGASGGVGIYAVQIAKALGAEVTAVCSAKKLDVVRSIGADHVVDYAKGNFFSSGQLYDLIIGANGNYPLSAYKRALTPNGTYICTGGSLSQIFGSMLLGSVMTLGSGKKIKNLAATPSKSDLSFLKELLEAHKIVPVIDKRYPLREAPEAFRYFGKGHTTGKVIVTVSA